MANGENLQSQDQNLNNETSNEEVNNNQINDENLNNQTASDSAEENQNPVTEEKPVEEAKKETETENTPPEPDTSDKAEVTQNEDKVDEVVSESENQTEETKPEVKPDSSSNEQVPPESKEKIKEETSEPKEEVKAEDKKDKKPDKKDDFDEIYQELKNKQESNERISVTVIKKIRGGLRVTFKNMPLFLPASHFSLKRNPNDSDLNDVVGKEIEVLVKELSEEEKTGRKTVIVTRKPFLEEAFWNNIHVGDKVEGVVSSIASFGVFLDLGGVEGLIHISRLSQSHIDHPKNVCKKGDKLKAVVVDLNRKRERIALSRKELEDSPWENVEDEFPKDTVHKGIVKRLTDFGAYVELKPGVDGLLRTNEISWTQRISKPGDILNVGDEIDVHILSSNATKRTASLSYKRTLTNPWDELKDKYPLDTELKGTVKQIVAQGAVITIENSIDGFMPRSKMRDIIKGSKIPYKVGDEIDVKIADLVPDKESLILAPVLDEAQKEAAAASRQQEPRRRGGGGGASRSKPSSSSNDDNAFTFMDLLSDSEKENLSNVNK